MTTEEQKFTSKRILIIDSTGHPHETNCYQWKDLDKIPNIADYDVVIIDTTSLPFELFDVIRNRKVRNLNPNKVDLLLKSNGTLFIIASNRFKSKENKSILINNQHWFSADFTFSEEQGETIADIKPKFKRYFENVKSWTYTIYLSDSIPLAKSRYNKPLVVKSIADDILKKIFEAKGECKLLNINSNLIKPK